jgi:hypothetical protein
MIKYRVVIKVSYNEAWFEFDSADQACGFATNALTHMVSNEDCRKSAKIRIEAVDIEAEKEEEDD